jgi:hypothetical protein
MKFLNKHTIMDQIQFISQLITTLEENEDKLKILKRMNADRCIFLLYLKRK